MYKDMSPKFDNGQLVKSDTMIYQVIRQPEENNDKYSLKFLSYLGDYYSVDIIKDYSSNHSVTENELSNFEGNPPKFSHGQYVTCSKFNSCNYSSRIFSAKYENYNYIYFVQERARPNLFEGDKTWIEEDYLQPV